VKALLRERGVDANAVPQAVPQARALYERILAAEWAPTIDTFHGWFLRFAPARAARSGAVCADLLEHTEACAATRGNLTGA